MLDIYISFRDLWDSALNDGRLALNQMRLEATKQVEDLKRELALSDACKFHGTGYHLLVLRCKFRDPHGLLDLTPLLQMKCSSLSRSCISRLARLVRSLGLAET